MLPDSPVEAATHPDPYPYYAGLPSFAFDSGWWVAADAASVAEILTNPSFRVRPPAEPVPSGIVGTPAGEVFGQLVRMTDGGEQARLKKIVVQALGAVDPVMVRALAAQSTAAALDSGKADYEHMMFGVPAQVVARLCGLDDGRDREASRLIGDFVQCIPAGASPQQQRLAAGAAGQLQNLLGPSLKNAGLLADLVRIARHEQWPAIAPILANGIGLLSQTYDATAGLIGNTLLALNGASPADLPAVIREVIRHDAPIQNTRRFTASSVRMRNYELPAGAPVLVLLAAANRDPAVNSDPAAFRPDRADPVVFTFSAGAHRCPGQELASAITAGVVSELIRAGAALVELEGYRPSPNARIPELKMLLPSPDG